MDELQHSRLSKKKQPKKYRPSKSKIRPMCSDSDSDDWMPPVICDNGSGLIKAGFCGSSSPRSVFPTIVGRVRSDLVNVMVGNGEERCVGDEAMVHRGIMSLDYPVQHGVITNWDDMELIWHHTFYNELRIDTSENPLILTESHANGNTGQREKMAEIMFETHSFPKLFISPCSPLSLYASGRTTGTIVSSGDGVTNIVPIYEGYTLPHAIQRFDVAGREMTEYLADLLTQQGHYFTSTCAEIEIVRDMKERLCYVCDPAEDQDPAAEYKLPDHSVVTLTDERWWCGEAMFEPSRLGMESEGIHTKVYNSIMKCDLDLKTDLYQNIILSGGNTMFEGFPERLEKEISKLAPEGKRVKVIAPPERKFSVWIGASILTSMSEFQKKWVTKGEYEEEGPRVINRKCSPN